MVGKRLFELSKSCGLTQKAVADSMGVKRQRVNQIFNQENITFETVNIIIDIIEKKATRKVNREWVSTGEGTKWMYENTNNLFESKERQNHDYTSKSIFEKYVQELEIQNKELREDKKRLIIELDRYRKEIEELKKQIKT